MTTNEEVRKVLSANVRRLLEHHDWSLSKLARETDQAVATIKSIADGNSNCTVGVALRIAQAFDITLNDLVAPPRRRSPAAA